MADDIPVTGAMSYIQYGWESTYGSASGTIDKAFGHDVKITNIERDHGSIPIYALGSNDPSKAAAGKFAGSISVEFVMASTYFMRAVLGLETIGGAGPYTHTYAYNTGNVVTSITIEHGIDLDTDNVYKYLGCVLRTCEIVCSINEPIKVRLIFDYANESLAAVGYDASPATDSEEPFSYSQASLEIPNGTVINRVQSFTLTINRNPTITYSLDDRRGQKAVWGETRWEWRMTVAEENDDLIADAYGQATGPLQKTLPSGEASLELTIQNSDTSPATDERKLVFLMSTTHIGSDTMSVEVGSVIFHDFSGYCLGKTSIIGTDNTTPTP